MGSDALDTEYENGVADVLAFLAHDAATVDRNVRVLGARSGKYRQIDVRVTGRVFGAGAATMVVDCKRYKKPIDVNTVGTFVGLVEDVGADIGLLVTTTGASDAAREYASNVRGIRLDILSLAALAAWSPKGTVHFDYAVPDSLYSEATRSARRVGFRVRPVAVDKWRNLDGHLAMSAFRHFGVANPSGEVQSEARERLLAALHKVGATDPIAMTNGVVIGGGTPAHQWLEVSLSGHGTGLKVLVASEQDIWIQLESLANGHSIPLQMLDVVRPDIWPIPLMFPSWG
ncbi:restriction endonuclease [Specibacter cremeus]|uniref:restriction endonuclease n=1 Tax=Specibacter cremeus TaxID=1629051 RepID=UPI00197B52CD|nr:restriction endonuclease [Specibacter cremeus]